MSIIRSLLDTDLYKFTTSYAYSKLFPRAYGIFKFIDRDNKCYPSGFAQRLQEEIRAMAQLSLLDSEVEFLEKNMPYLPPTYIDFLKGFRFAPEEIQVSQDAEGHLDIWAEGLLYRVTLWETPILALVSELFYKMSHQTADDAYLYEQACRKAQKMKERAMTFSLFGMRRRFSYEVEDEVTKILKAFAGNALYGTSNMHLAHKHQLNVTGTHPHEWVQFHGAIYGYKMANYMAMENWIDVYDGDLGTVLTDTYTSDIFLKNFSKKHAQLFTGLRHDSGDPLLFVEKVLKRYEQLKVDPKTKYLIFSDGLDIEKAWDIHRHCSSRIKCTYGIGTNLTNDVGNDTVPANIVMKLWACKMTKNAEWHHCVKLSDVQGKHTGRPSDIQLCQAVLGIAPLSNIEE